MAGTTYAWAATSAHGSLPGPACTQLALEALHSKFNTTYLFNFNLYARACAKRFEPKKTRTFEITKFRTIYRAIDFKGLHVLNIEYLLQGVAKERALRAAAPGAFDE